MPKKPTLYIDSHCALCREVLAFFDHNGIQVLIKDITHHPEHQKQLLEDSGQHHTPAFVLDDFVIAQFSVPELLEELEANPEVKKSLGLGFYED